MDNRSCERKYSSYEKKARNEFNQAYARLEPMTTPISVYSFATKYFSNTFLFVSILFK